MLLKILEPSESSEGNRCIHGQLTVELPSFQDTVGNDMLLQIKYLNSAENSHLFIYPSHSINRKLEFPSKCHIPQSS